MWKNGGENNFKNVKNAKNVKNNKKKFFETL